MAYDARAIANWFLDRAQEDGRTLTQMKLQKLAYIAHGWHLGLAGEPLIREPVEAWQWGPVFRSLYREFRGFGSDPITSRATVFSGTTLQEEDVTLWDFDSDADSTSEFLEEVWNEYGELSAVQLMSLTHQPDTPWSDTYDSQLRFVVIPDSTIEEYYHKLASDD